MPAGSRTRVAAPEMMRAGLALPPAPAEKTRMLSLPRLRPCRRHVDVPMCIRGDGGGTIQSSSGSRYHRLRGDVPVASGGVARDEWRVALPSNVDRVDGAR